MFLLVPASETQDLKRKSKQTGVWADICLDPLLQDSATVHDSYTHTKTLVQGRDPGSKLSNKPIKLWDWLTLQFFTLCKIMPGWCKTRFISLKWVTPNQEVHRKKKKNSYLWYSLSSLSTHQYVADTCNNSWTISQRYTHLDHFISSSR